MSGCFGMASGISGGYPTYFSHVAGLPLDVEICFSLFSQGSIHMKLVSSLVWFCSKANREHGLLMIAGNLQLEKSSTSRHHKTSDSGSKFLDLIIWM